MPNKYTYREIFREADILLPKLGTAQDWSRWAVIACDQFTSDTAYWKRAADFVNDAPSALNLILPEAYLDQAEERIPQINAQMKQYENGVLELHPDAMIYLRRTLPDGTVRCGIIGKIDLEAYDYSKDSTSPIRATEGTVLSRIPPRVKIRRGADVELPHIMILIDDPKKECLCGNVIEPLAEKCSTFKTAYSFDLMEGGGHVDGYFIPAEEIEEIKTKLAALGDAGMMSEKYNLDCPPLIYAMGDGNHSLASAKAFYEEIKAEIGEEAAAVHPARYALAEIVNLHDDSLVFEPIYRTIFGANAEDLLAALEKYTAGEEATSQSVHYYTADKDGEIAFTRTTHALTVGTLQNFLDEYAAAHPEIEVDYIHGVEDAITLAKNDASGKTVSFIFDGMRKDELFYSVIKDGALPRKTFSMGEARSKRYYIEARKITK